MEQKNMILAIALSIAIIMGWSFFFEAPRIQQQQEQQAQTAAEQQKASTAPGGGTDGKPVLGAGSVTPSVSAADASALSREDALKKSERIEIRSGRLHGSISLIGGRIDDLLLKDYHEDLDKSSPEIVLLRPTGSDRPYFAEFGWVGKEVKTPTIRTKWAASGDALTPSSPVTLSWENGEGLVFEQEFQMDDAYLIIVTQRIRNTGAAAVSLEPYGRLSRATTPKTLGFYILHEGPLGVFDGVLKEVDYDDLRELRDEKSGAKEIQDSTGGWLGITDKYWLAALIPDQTAKLKTSMFARKQNGADIYQVDYVGEQRTIQPGASVELTSNFFAGAKEVRLIDKYETELGIANFDLAVDFGWFYYLTKPIFYAILWLNDHLGNFGLAILALTIAIKLVFFPLANKSYVSMSKMKKLQPKMVELRERHGEDRQRLNQEMMALYKNEKVNPASGCLPMLVQIPVFFALYKVLFVAIEMRHAPFYGWIHDLSAPDPLGILTLFGFVQWDIPAILLVANIGIWPILMGLSMFLQQKLNPAPADPMQAKIFMLMPIMFTFLLGSFPAGLVIYWTWNNVLSMAQQYIIMKRMGVAIGGGSEPAAGGKT